MLVLDISTVWELPGHHSFHASSHPSWKEAKTKKTVLKLYKLVILNLCDRAFNQTKVDASGRKSEHLQNSTKKSVATRQQWRLHFVQNEFSKIRRRLICTTPATSGISFPKDAFFCWKAPCHLWGKVALVRGWASDGVSDKKTSEVAPTVKILSLSQGGTFISQLCQYFWFSDFEFSANLISTAVNSS